MIETLADGFITELERLWAFLPRLLIALVVAAAIYLAGKFLAVLLVRILRRTSLSETYFSYFRKLVKVLFLFIGFIAFLNLIGYQTLAASILAGGGLTAVMLGFAFKDIGENLLAGFFLAFSRPFGTHDLIESDGILGRVQDIQLRHTHVRTADGCDVFIPSAQLFTRPLHNYTLDGLRRGHFTVGIDYGDDAKQAAGLLLETVKASKNIIKSPPPSVQIRGFDPGCVDLQVSFWINARNQETDLPTVRTEIMNACRVALKEKGFTFSADVSTAVTLSPVDVHVGKKED